MLDVQNLCKSFEKKSQLLTELTFQVEAGECLILLGRNGAGKTLLLNILATLVEPTSGNVYIDGVDAFTHLKQVRPSIGYISGNFEGYPRLSVTDYLNFFAAAYKLDTSERASAIDAVLELTDIQHLRADRISVLSAGERQRLLFAKTFLHDPKLWLLDEPFAQLDARGQNDMTALLEEVQAMGKTVVLATNRIDDVSQLSDSDSRAENFVGILEGGRFAVLERFRELKRTASNAEQAEHPSPHWFNTLFLEVTKT